MRATVFGAQGFVGGHLARHLDALGYAVSAFARGDEAWRGQQLGHVYYCAGVTADFRTRPLEAMEAHAGLVTDLLRHAEFESLLYLSSTRVYRHAASTSETARIAIDPSDSDQLYDISKLAGEAACHTAGRENVRIARLSNVVGDDQSSANFLPSLIAEARVTGHVRFRSAPESEKDYIWIDDVVAALAAIASRGSERCYNVASGHNISNADVAAALEKHLGCTTSFEPGAPLVRFAPIDVARLRQLSACRHPNVLDRLFAVQPWSMSN